MLGLLYTDLSLGKWYSQTTLPKGVKGVGYIFVVMFVFIRVIYLVESCPLNQNVVIATIRRFNPQSWKYMW